MAVAENINILPILVEPFKARNNPAIELIEAKNITQLSKSTELPMMVENTELPW